MTGKRTAERQWWENMHRHGETRARHTAGAMNGAGLIVPATVTGVKGTGAARMKWWECGEPGCDELIERPTDYRINRHLDTHR